MYIRLTTWIRQRRDTNGRSPEKKKNTGKVDIVNALVSASFEVHANVNEFFE